MSVDLSALQAIDRSRLDSSGPIDAPRAIKEGVLQAIGIEPIDRLRPHEETLTAAMAAVAQGILETDAFRWPIIIDGASGVILDGMHRWGLLRTFRFRYVPVLRFDYLADRAIRLDVWCRLLQDVTPGGFASAAELFGLREVPVPLAGIAKRTGALIVGPDNQVYRFPLQEDPVSTLRRLNAFEGELGMRLKLQTSRARYVAEQTALEQMLHPMVVATFPPPLTKQDVVAIAAAGQVFPAKTTRHIFPWRVFDVHVTLHQLQDAPTAEGLEDAVRAEHAALNLRYLGRQVTLDRLYEEPMFQFQQPGATSR